jgi:hypothetical protein
MRSGWGNRMAVNLDKPQRWKEDIALSVDLYNEWFLKFAPRTYREERGKATKDVEAMLGRTNRLRSLTPNELTENPSILFALRMCTAPPIARDRLVGLAGDSPSCIRWRKMVGFRQGRRRLYSMRT